MNRVRAASVLFGVAFGFLLSWGTLTDPDTIRRMLLLEEAYVFLMMASAVAVGFVGVRLFRRVHGRALLTGERVELSSDRPERRHIFGSILFGLGWAVADTCPGPITAQLGQGFPWALCTGAGVVAGVLIYLAREGRTARSAAAPRDVPGVAWASAPE